MKYVIPISTKNRILPRGSIVKHTYRTPEDRRTCVEYLHLRHCRVELGNDPQDVRSDADISYAFENCLVQYTCAGPVYHASPKDLEDTSEFEVLRYGMTNWQNDLDRSKFEELLDDIKKSYPCTTIFTRSTLF